MDLKRKANRIVDNFLKHLPPNKVLSPSEKIAIIYLRRAINRALNEAEDAGAKNSYC
jgi:hypothetical protein